MGYKSITKADRIRADKLRELGCVICLKELGAFTPPAIHHISGKTKENSHQLTIPLCPRHHQHKDNNKPPMWISRHGDGRAAFEEAYGTEGELLDYVNGLICA